MNTSASPAKPEVPAENPSAGRQTLSAIQLYFGSIILLLVVAGIVKFGLKMMLG